MKPVYLMTDRELFNCRRRIIFGADYLYSIVNEQFLRGLLREQQGGYPNELVRSGQEYPENQRSKRIKNKGLYGERIRPTKNSIYYQSYKTHPVDRILVRWKCPGCATKGELFLVDMAEVGTAICEECGNDMEMNDRAELL